MYKVNEFKDKQISRITVFYGRHDIKDIDNLFLSDPANVVFNNIFSKLELDNIFKNNIKVHFSDQSIYIDDSILTIKIKIINEYPSHSLSIEELYIFYVHQELLNSTSIYQYLTQNNKVKITKPILDNFLKNIIDDTFEIETKEAYNFNDIFKLNLDTVHLVNKSMCQLFEAQLTDYQFVINPYSITQYDKTGLLSSAKFITTLNNNLLLDNKQLYENNIYLCLAQNVLAAHKNEEDLTVKLYFPLLYDLQILSTKSLLENRQQLIDKNKLFINQTQQLMNHVNLFYDINKTIKLPIVASGIKTIKIQLLPVQSVKIPLDVIFKLIHASKTNPLIKYNTASKQDKLYRLYTDILSEDGRKIPYLDKSEIFKLGRTIAKTKLVSVFIDYNKENIICDFDDQGNIFISCEFNEIQTINEIDELFKTAVNPIINVIKTYLEQNGYNVNIFNSINDSGILINKLTLNTIIKIHNTISVDESMPCIASVFNIESKNLNKDMRLRFKRVSNFINSTSQEAFVIEQQKNGMTIEEIKQGLIDNFGMSDAKIIELFTKLGREEQQLQDYGKKNKEIKINPGFKTTISIIKQNIAVKQTPQILISVEDINNLQYLNTLPIYIDSFIRLTQPGYLNENDKSKIKKICSASSITKQSPIKIFEDIQGISDIVFEETPILTSEEISEVDLFNFWDDDSAGNIAMGKGKDSSSSDSDSDSDSDSNSDSDSDIKNIDGMKLAHPTPFFKKMNKLEPKLFLNNPKGKYKAYSRLCGSTDRKQPILLTHREKTKIDKEKPGFFNKQDVLKYGSDSKNNPYYYVCPRYWCLKTNSPMTPEEVKSGKCGKVIPRDARVVPKGAYVYEFFDPKEHGSKDDYIQHYPGFSTLKNTSEDGRCIPCCFKTFNQPKKLKINETCMANDKKKKGEREKGEDKGDGEDGEDEGDGEDGEDKEEDGEEDEEGDDEEDDEGEDDDEDEDSDNVLIKPLFSEKPTKNNYIIGPDKFNLEQYRRGYLPISIQLFLNETNMNYTINKKSREVQRCLLRYGVEQSTNQSFISCVADACSKQYTNQEFKEKLVSSLTLDKFIEYQNGNLYSTFVPNNYENSNVNINKYKKTILYSKITNNELAYFKNVVASFENFIKYINDPDIFIDYEYLWDIICDANPDIFEKGINLVILEILNNDATNNVQLICPTNTAASILFNPRKPCLFLVSMDNIYQPIYLFSNNGKKEIITKLLTTNNKEYNYHMKMMFKTVIIPAMRNACMPTQINTEYTFSPPTTCEDIIKTMLKYKYDIKEQVINFYNKVIALIILDGEEEYFIPCNPSALVKNYDYIFINDESIQYKPYDETIEYLTEFSLYNKKTIKCLPKFKIIEDEYIVGILTESNQVVQLSEPILAADVMDNIKELRHSGLNVTDTELALQYGKHDIERISYIKKIKLDTIFYNAFRNRIRMLLNNVLFLETREKIEEEIHSSSLYFQKLISIKKQLKILTTSNISFIESFDPKLLEEIYSCSVKNEEGCTLKKSLCVFSTKSNICKIIFPKKQLATGIDNSELFYSKMADELVRYSRIRSFMFQPKSFLSFNSLGFNLRADEIIIMESMLTPSYFENLIPTKHNNKYIAFNNPDNTNPQIYKNTIAPDNTFMQPRESIDCKNTFQKDTIKSIFWRQQFPKNYSETMYSCAAYALIYLINKPITVETLKKELYEEYMKYFPEYEMQILNILLTEGKKENVKNVKNGSLSFRSFIQSPDYFITHLDIWVMVTKYKIPTILLSSKNLQYTNYKENYFALFFTTKTDKYSFIMTSAIHADSLPVYKIIKDDQNDHKISMPSSLSFPKVTLEDYLATFVKEPTTTYKKKQ
jgi:hypothetical protein